MYKKWFYMCLWGILFTLLIVIIKVSESSATDADRLVASVMQIAMETRIVADDKGNMIYVSRSAAEIAGYGRDELYGQNIEALIPERYHQEHRLHYQLALKRDDEAIAQIKCEIKKKDGTERLVELRVRVMHSSGKKMVLVTITPLELIEEV